ncbi:LuxR C-terminal-related transcriptional regulator [Streptomyces sp. NPDC048337]|uniref:LuxR C-terminal-related transcriptional regulator n=1 Tax=Streptomyces sp. NPDC048337 TaxID=3365535 RepID=UPI0037114D47
MSALMIQGDMAGALTVTERALAEQFPSAQWRLRLDACRVLALADLHRAAEALALAGPLVEQARSLGDPLCGSEAHHALSFALFHLGRGRDSLRHVAEGIAYARRSPAANDMRLLLLANQAEGHMRFDEQPVVARALREARELAVATRSTGRLVVTEARLAEFHYRLGDWDETLEGVSRACALPVSDGWLPVVVHGLRALVLGHRDEREAARAELAALPAGAFATPAARRYASHVLLARALLAERDGRPGDALRALLPELADGAEEEAAYERPWVLSEIVRLALESGEAATARAAVAACGRAAAALPEYPGPALALLRCRGLFAQDPGLLEEAVARGERGRWPLVLGHTLEDLAVARAWHGDLAGARSALTRAVAAYEEPGARWDIARADARLRSLGVRRGSRSARRRPANGWEALTPAELKVALLVAQGRSNPEIANALFLSRRTVQTHVSHILAKLQVRSRAAVAAQAAARSAGP